MLHCIIYSLPALASFAGAVYLLFCKSVSSVQLRRNMAVLLVLLGIAVFCYAQYFNPHFHTSWGFDFIYCLTAPFCAPCYFLFLNRLTTVNGGRVRNFVAFFPTVIFVLISIMAYAFSTPADRLAYIANIVQGEHFLYEPTVAFRLLEIVGYKIFRVFIPLQAVVVVIYGEIVMKRYLTLLDDFYSTREGKGTFQIRGIHTFTILVFIISLFLSMIPHYDNSGELWIVIPFVLCEIYMVIVLIRHVNNITYSAENLQVLIDASKPREEDGAKSVDYSKNLPSKLKKIMEVDRMYLDPTLSLITLSAKLGTNRTYVSQAVKSAFGCNFSDFVNKYRIDYAVELMKSRPKSEIFIQNIATECGCGSVQTFYRYFKQYIGETPTKWMESYEG